MHYLIFCIIFFRGGAEQALERLKQRKILSNDEANRLKDAILRNYQIWYLIDSARENFSLNVDENWALALISSVLIENIVKKSLLEFEATPTRSFEENAKKLYKILEEQDILTDLQKKVRFDLHELSEAWSSRKILAHEVYNYPITPQSAQRAYERALSMLGYFLLSRILSEKYL